MRYDRVRPVCEGTRRLALHGARLCAVHRARLRRTNGNRSVRPYGLEGKAPVQKIARSDGGGGAPHMRARR